MPDQLSDNFEVDRAIAPRNQTAADDDSASTESDAVPSFGADQFNLKRLSQQQPMDDAEEAESSERSLKIKPPKALKKRVLVFKASWCGACQSLNFEWPKLEAVNWKIGSNEQSHFQIVDADERPDLMAKYGVSSLPTVILVEDEREIARHGLLGAFSLAELYYGRLK